MNVSNGFASIPCNLAQESSCRLTWSYDSTNDLVKFKLGPLNLASNVWYAVGFNEKNHAMVSIVFLSLTLR